MIMTQHITVSFKGVGGKKLNRVGCENVEGFNQVNVVKKSDDDRLRKYLRHSL